MVERGPQVGLLTFHQSSPLFPLLCLKKFGEARRDRPKSSIDKHLGSLVEVFYK